MMHLRTLLLILIALSLPLAACGGEAELEEPASTAPSGAPGAQAPATLLPAAAGPTEEQPLPRGAIGKEPFRPFNAMLGDRVEYEGYLLIAVTLEDPAKAKLSHAAAPGTRLVAVEVVVGCMEAEQARVDPRQAVLVASGGYIYPAQLGAMADHDDLAASEIGAREKAQGWVAFEIPDGSNPKYIKYEFDADNGLVLSSLLQ